MSKLVEAFLADALKHEKVQSGLQGLLAKILDMLSPLLIGVAVVLGITLLASVSTLVLVLRKGGVGV